ncbi:MAG: PfkB family carbohydrate kinase [Pirellulales bacterium]
MITIVGLGEALWDVLPGGKVLGGAPLNVACHVHALLQGSPSHGGSRGQAVVASRVGTDALGDEVVRELVRRGMANSYVQRDAVHPTSTVNVELQAGQPTFTFAPDVAWDHLEFTPEWTELAARCDAACFGTLAQRSPGSRETIWRFLDAAPQAIRLFDVNLRQGFYDRESILEGCRRATLIKLNEQELPVVVESVGLSAGSPHDQLARLRDKFDLAAVVFTRGERGTMMVLESEIVDLPPVSYPMGPGADAVGAGDACSAGVLVGWLLGLPLSRIAELANHLGAFVASQPGATPELPLTITAMID